MTTPSPDDILRTGLANIDHFNKYAERAFCIVPRGKRPNEPGWNHTGHTHTTAESALRRGENVGLIAGLTDDYAIIDIDRHLSRFLEMFPAFNHCLKIYRTNAPEKAKFMVRIDGNKPRSMKHHEKVDGSSLTVFELFSSSGQAVIAGQHASGAIIDCNYEEPLTLTFDSLAAIVQQYTGRTLDPYTVHLIDKPERDNIAADDTERARQNLARLHPRRADEYLDWIRVGYCLKSLGESGLALWDEWSKQSPKYKQGECKMLWGKMKPQRITLRTLTHIANEDDPAGKWGNDESENRKIIAAWAAIIIDYPFTGRSAEHQRAVAMAFLMSADDADSLEFAASYEQLALKAGTTGKTARNQVVKQAFAFMVEQASVGDRQFASTWRLLHIEPERATLTNIHACTLNIEEATFTPSHSKSMHGYKSMWVSTWRNCSFVRLMGNDAFIASRVGGKKRKPMLTRQPDDEGLSPMLTLTERRRALLARTMHRLTREANTDVFSGQYKSLKPFQVTGLRILDLYERGQRGSPATFADVMGCGVQTVRDAIKRMSDSIADYDIEPVAWIHRNGDGTTEICVAENWREVVDKARPYMVTDGVQAKRNSLAAIDRIARAEDALTRTRTGKARVKLQNIIDGAHDVLERIHGKRNAIIIDTGASLADIAPTVEEQAPAITSKSQAMKIYNDLFARSNERELTDAEYALAQSIISDWSSVIDGQRTEVRS